MLHWASLLIAVILLAIAGVILAEAPKNKLAAGLLAIVAMIVWLLGKAARYILTGASETPTTPWLAESQTSSLRRASVPPAGLRFTLRPWASPSDT